MTDYNDGKWHGWNGGECPVHPESLVEVRFLNDGPPGTSRNAGKWIWPHDGNIGDIIAFRVVTPHIEPKEYSGECWAYHFTRMSPSLVENELSETIKGRWTATHVNGRLAKITWEAAE